MPHMNLYYNSALNGGDPFMCLSIPVDWVFQDWDYILLLMTVCLSIIPIPDICVIINSRDVSSVY